jgi:hypothetical protein
MTIIDNIHLIVGWLLIWGSHVSMFDLLHIHLYLNIHLLVVCDVIYHAHMSNLYLKFINYGMQTLTFNHQMQSLTCCHLSSLYESHHHMCGLFDLSFGAMCGLFIYPMLTYNCSVHLIVTCQMFWCIHMSLFYSNIFHLKMQTQTYRRNIWSVSCCHLSRSYLLFTRMLEFRDFSHEAMCQFAI